MSNDELPVRPEEDSTPDNDDSDGDSAWMSRKTIAIVLSAVFTVLFSAAVLILAPFLWKVAYIALVVGFVPGLLLFPWIASPFAPGLWVLSDAVTRIHFTISQIIRKAGVLVKRSSNEYEHATYLPDDDAALCADGTKVPIDDDRTSWGLFGKRRLGLTWEPGTDLHERVRANRRNGGDAESVTDGGEDELALNMGAAHRYFEGANDADVISRTEEKAEAEHGGGGDELSGLAMAMLIAFMLFLGSMTTFLML